MPYYTAFCTNIGVWSPSEGLQVLASILAVCLPSPDSGDTLPDIYVQSVPVRELYI